jgi:hypothetical protein
MVFPFLEMERWLILRGKSKKLIQYFDFSLMELESHEEKTELSWNNEFKECVIKDRQN